VSEREREEKILRKKKIKEWDTEAKIEYEETICM